MKQLMVADELAVNRGLSLKHRKEALKAFAQKDYVRSIDAFVQSSAFLIKIENRFPGDENILLQNTRYLSSAHNNAAIEKFNDNKTDEAFKHLNQAIQALNTITNPSATDIINLIQTQRNVAALFRYKQLLANAVEMDQYNFLLLQTLKHHPNTGMPSKASLNRLRQHLLLQIIQYYDDAAVASLQDKKISYSLEIASIGLTWIDNHKVLEEALKIYPDFFKHYCSILIAASSHEFKNKNFNQALIILNIGYQFAENKQILAPELLKISNMIAQIYLQAAREFYAENKLDKAFQYYYMAISFVKPTIDGHDQIYDHIHRELAKRYYHFMHYHVVKDQQCIYLQIYMLLKSIKHKTKVDHKLLDRCLHRFNHEEKILSRSTAELQPRPFLNESILSTLVDAKAKKA